MIFRKRLSVILLCLIMAFSICMSACSAGKDDDTTTTGTTEQQQEIGNETTEDEIKLLDAIYRSNRLDSITLDYKNVYTETVYTDVDGKEVYRFKAYGDANTYVSEGSNGNITVMTGGKEYSYNASENKAYIKSFPDGTYKPYVDARRNYVIRPAFADESIVSATRHGDDYVVKTKISSESILAMMNLYNPYQKFSGDSTCMAEYHVSPFTFEIRSISVYIIERDGKHIEVAKSEITYDADYQIPEIAQELMSGQYKGPTSYVKHTP